MTKRGIRAVGTLSDLLGTSTRLRLITRVVTVMLVLLTVVPAVAQQKQLKDLDAAGTMKGLKILSVVVEEIPELEGRLRASTIKTDLELKLRQIGVNVPAPDDRFADLAPYVYVNINVLNLKSGGFIYNIDISFKRVVQVTVPDGPSTDVYLATVNTWSSGLLGITGSGDVRALRDAINDQVSKFLNTYLSVNPLQR